MNKSDEMRKYVFSIVVFALLCLLLLAGCSSVKNNSNTANNGVTDDSLSRVNERGKLIVGTYEQIEPMTFLDKSGNNIGQDIDLIREIASQMDVELEIKNIFFSNLFSAVASGEIDLAISAITITPERSKNYLFSTPYFDNGQVLVTRNDTGINGLEDLKDKKIGVLKSSTGEKAALESEHINSSLITSFNMEDGFVEQGLVDGKIDAIIIDLSGAGGTLKNNPALIMVGEPFTQEYYGIMAKFGSDALMNEINKILRDMKRTGRLDEIKDKWLE